MKRCLQKVILVELQVIKWDAVLAIVIDMMCDRASC